MTFRIQKSQKVITITYINTKNKPKSSNSYTSKESKDRIKKQSE